MAVGDAHGRSLKTHVLVSREGARLRQVDERILVCCRSNEQASHLHVVLVLHIPPMVLRSSPQTFVRSWEGGGKGGIGSDC
jgi:hypothetical protein